MVSATIRTIRSFIGIVDRGGQITAVEAMGASLPYGMQSGWGE